MSCFLISCGYSLTKALLLYAREKLAQGIGLQFQFFFLAKFYKTDIEPFFLTWIVGDDYGYDYDDGLLFAGNALDSWTIFSPFSVTIYNNGHYSRKNI